MREPQKVCFTKLLESSQFKSLEPLCSVIISSFLLYIQKVTSGNLIIDFLIQWCPLTYLLSCLHSGFFFFFLSFPSLLSDIFFFPFSHIPHSSFKFYLWVDLGLGHSYNGLLLSCYQLTNTIFHKRCPRTSWKQSFRWVSTWNHHSQKSVRVFCVYLFIFFPNDQSFLSKKDPLTFSWSFFDSFGTVLPCFHCSQGDKLQKE